LGGTQNFVHRHRAIQVHLYESFCDSRLFLPLRKEKELGHRGPEMQPTDVLVHMQVWSLQVWSLHALEFTCEKNPCMTSLFSALHSSSIHLITEYELAFHTGILQGKRVGDAISRNEPRHSNDIYKCANPI
jgi:hypothetical protein